MASFPHPCHNRQGAGPAILSPQHQSQLSSAAQVMRGRASSPKCGSWKGVGLAQHNAWTTTWPQVAAQTKALFDGNTGFGHRHRPQHRSHLQQGHRPRHGLQWQPWSRCHHGLQWQPGPRCHHGLVWQHRPLRSVWPLASVWPPELRPLTFRWTLVATQATEISIDSCCGKAMDPDVALGGSLG